MSRKNATPRRTNVSVSVQSSGGATLTQRQPQNQARLILYVAIGLCVLTFSVFVQAIHFDFINLDDDIYVSQNPTIQKGITTEGIEYAFTAQMPYWHPTTWLSHMLDCQLFGLNAGWHHLTNVILHTANVIVLFLLLLRLTEALWRSALVAALFAVHPLHVESVAWIAERKDVLSCLFWLLTIWMYVSYTRGPNSRSKYIISLLLFTLAVMSKPTVVTLPFVLLLLDFWPLKRLTMASAGTLLRKKIPFFLLSMGSSAITYVGQTRAGAVTAIGTTPRIANALVSYVLYLRDLIWPQSLGVLYPIPLSIPGSEVFFSVLILAVITTLVVWFARKLPYLPVGWFWFLGVLVPMIGFLQVGDQARADRFTYISAIGIFLIVAWAATDAAKHYSVPRRTLGGLSAVLLFALAARSWDQLRFWKNSEYLETHTIAITGRNPVLKNNLGSTLNSEQRVREAELYFRSAVLEAPGYAEAYTNLGINLLAQQKWIEALDALNQAIRLKPNNAAAIFQRGVALSQLNRVPEAIRSFQDALRYNLSPLVYVAVAHEYLGQLWLQTGHNEDALKELDTALAMNPDSVEARVNRALVLAALGRLQESATELTRLRTTNPKDERILRAWQYVQSRLQAGSDAKATR
jgi:tetratricopeptide (TPR) repeat protein